MLSSINFNHEDILKIIRNLVQNKAHGQDGNLDIVGTSFLIVEQMYM